MGKKFLVVNEHQGCGCRKTPKTILIGDWPSPAPDWYIPGGPGDDFEVLSWAGVRPRFTDLGKILFSLVIKGEEVVFRASCPVCGQEVLERFYLSEKDE